MLAVPGIAATVAELVAVDLSVRYAAVALPVTSLVEPTIVNVPLAATVKLFTPAPIVTVLLPLNVTLVKLVPVVPLSINVCAVVPEK